MSAPEHLGEDSTTAAPVATTGAAVVRVRDAGADEPLRARLGRVARRPARPLLRGTRRVWFGLRLDMAGLALAVLFFCLSLTPSLVPRTWAFQSLVSGITTTIGYAVGVLIAVLLRALWRPARSRFTPPRPVVLGVWWTGLAVGVAGVAGYLVASASWQTELRELVVMDSPGPGHYLRVVGLGFGMLFAVLLLWRALRWLARRLARLLARRVPPRLALAVATLVVGAMVGTALNGLLVPGVLGATNDAFAALNQEDADTPPPTSRYRSGGPDSLVSWDEMGREGRIFVGGGPDVEDLTAFAAGRADASAVDDVREPVRVYAGLGGTDDLRTRARLVVAELERTGAFRREVLAVATVTGTGWIDPVAVDALEYVHGGDTAVAAMQYSYLPSAISFVLDVRIAEQAGRVLFDAVEQRWAELPPGERPRLIAYGESLGALGSAAAFEDLDDLVDRADGAFWVGPPSATRLVRSWTAQRDPGSSTVQPVLDGGATVRFWDRHGAGGDAVPAGTPWRAPRVVVLQHPSDPVVWWSPDLLFRQPDWLVEPHGDDVLPGFDWHPFVTFWQVAADMAASGQAPHGYAHRYGRAQIEGWAAVTEAAGWTEADTTALDAVLLGGRAPG